MFLLVLALCCRSTCQFRGNSEKSNHMLSATSHIGLEFLTKFLNMSKLQNRLILLYQSLPLQLSTVDKTPYLTEYQLNSLFTFSFIGISKIIPLYFNATLYHKYMVILETQQFKNNFSHVYNTYSIKSVLFCKSSSFSACLKFLEQNCIRISTQLKTLFFPRFPDFVENQHLV